MNDLGRRLLLIRKQRKLSLRQVERLTMTVADRYGDKARRVSASWLGRIERESHAIAHKRLESLEEVYGVSREELTDDPVPGDEGTRSLHFQFPEVPTAVLRALTRPGGPLLPPESWLAYFPDTTLLPPLTPMDGNGSRPVRRHWRENGTLYGVLGAKDATLVPFVRPGAVVEIDSSVRTISAGRIFPSILARPIYFLRSHDGYHCGWCELDADEDWLTLVPSAMTFIAHRRWRYRHEVEVVGLVNRVLTRLGFPEHLASEYESRHGHSLP
jgi:transcriptional regulator with XRE-family HTH domain